MKAIPLTRGLVALVDDADYDELSQHKWQAHATRGAWYATRYVTVGKRQRKTVAMHNQVMNAAPGTIDHIDRDGLNNQRGNLRRCTFLQNCFNRVRSDRKSSAYRGAYPMGNRWRAQIQVNRKIIHIGMFPTDRAAAEAYDAAALRLHGEFAVTNFPTVPVTVEIVGEPPPLPESEAELEATVRAYEAPLKRDP